MIINQLRLACEEAALSSGLNVPVVQVINHSDLQASSDGSVLYLSSGIHDMAPAPLAAYLTLCLHFHSQLAHVLMVRSRESLSLGERLRFGWNRLSAALTGQPAPSLERNRFLGTPGLPYDPEQTLDLARLARQRAISKFESSQVALLQALLMVRGGQTGLDEEFAGAPLFEDAEQLAELAKYLEILFEGQFTDDTEKTMPQPNKMLRLAHKTSKLIEPSSPAAISQVAGLNRLYASIGPVGTLAHVISRLVSEQQSDAERVSVLTELLTRISPPQARLQLVDFAASRLLKLSRLQRQSLFARLREALSLSMGPASAHGVQAGHSEDPHILAWTLLSVLRSKIDLSETDLQPREVLNDKDKRRCISELFFVAAELGGEEASISARAIRNQVDAICEALGIDRPVSSPDEFQAAAWIEALEDLSRFSLHEALAIIDALSAWGKESETYQVWLDALCQYLHIQRESTIPFQPKVLTGYQLDDAQLQYTDGQDRAVHTER